MSSSSSDEEDKRRFLGSCTKCHKELIEYLDPGTRIWCYNAQLPEDQWIVFTGFSKKGDEPAMYRCRGCASKWQKAKHDRTF